MSLAEKYGLNPVNHVFGGDDLDWEEDNLDRIKANAILTQSCVVGVETMPYHQETDPGVYCGITYPDGFSFFVVVLRVREEDPTLSFPRPPEVVLMGKNFKYDRNNIPTTRVHRLTQWWATISVIGTDQLKNIVNAAQPHPDDEEENR